MPVHPSLQNTRAYAARDNSRKVGLAELRCPLAPGLGVLLAYITAGVVLNTAAPDRFSSQATVAAMEAAVLCSSAIRRCMSNTQKYSQRVATQKRIVCGGMPDEGAGSSPAGGIGREAVNRGFPSGVNMGTSGPAAVESAQPVNNCGPRPHILPDPPARTLERLAA